MNFYWDDIIGHERTILQLEKDILNNNLAHAYLFAGPADVGKYAVAKKFANILICQQNYCRTCNDCQQFKRNLHQDVITVNKLWIEKINEDLTQLASASNFNQINRVKKRIKTDTITIDDVRAISQKIYEKKQSLYKICLIKDIERLQDAGVNAFLKILEEPPKNTIFLLTASFPEQISETLLSRVRKINFTYVADNLIYEKLNRQTKTENLKEIVSIAQGRPPVAVRLLNNFSLFEQEKNRFHQIADLLNKKQLTQHFRWIESISDNLDEINALLEALIRFLRTLLLEKGFCRDAMHRVSTETLAGRFSYQQLIKSVELVKITQIQLKQNVNKKLLLENLVLNLQNLP